MTESQYEVRSHDAVDKSWAEYEARSWEAKKREYCSEDRVYYVDDDLVIAITE